MLRKIRKYNFLFIELVKRDFKKKYKRTVLGMLWSILSPLLSLLIMRLVFTHFFGNTTAHYTTFLFAGNIVFSYFNEATMQGMNALVGNAGIITKVNVPKYLFLLAQNIQTLINFMINMCVFMVFCRIDNIQINARFFGLLFPIFCLLLFNISMGLVLSALYVFFRDMRYIWSVLLQMLTYLSAIFYNVASFPEKVQRLYLLNPIYVYIKYFRVLIIDGHFPSLQYHGLCLFYALVMLVIGCLIYKKYNTRFLYYL